MKSIDSTQHRYTVVLQQSTCQHHAWLYCRYSSQLISEAALQPVSNMTTNTVLDCCWFAAALQRQVEHCVWRYCWCSKWYTRAAALQSTSKMIVLVCCSSPSSVCWLLHL